MPRSVPTIFFVFFVSSWLCVYGFLRPGATLRAQEMPERMARAIVEALAAGTFDSVKARFTPQMSAALPGDGLATIWRQLMAQAGSFKWIDDLVIYRPTVLTRVEILCTFEQRDAILTFTFNPAGRLAGIGAPRLMGAASATRLTWTPPAYATLSAFEEREITLGTGETISASLSMPTAAAAVPGVVLVGGAGPNDRDETVFPNRPMKDLAFGLASHGIAVLRYDKRSLLYPAQFRPEGAATVKEEVIDDTLAAIARLAATPGIDPARIIVAGHSLGGMLAPRIAVADRRVAGLVILAGPTRPTDVVIEDQVKYLEPGNAAALDAVRAFAAQINSPTLAATAVVEMLGQQTSGAYWLDLRGYRPADVAAALNIPIFALQGERDYQVAMADFAGWKSAFAGRSTAAFKSYPRLNHLFLEGAGSGRSLPAEYRIAGHVPEEVVADVAAWITALPARAR